jgi:hypothetical protein
MGVYRAGRDIGQQGQINQQAAEQAYRQGVSQLQQMRQQFQDSPDVARQIEETLREVQRFDPSKTPGNPALLEQIRTELLPTIEELELKLRRKLDGTDGQVRTSTAERIPQGYSDAVAEYFRRLSKTK